MTIPFYFLLFLLLFWNYAGYILFLAFLANRKKPAKIKPKAHLPSVTIIIPCFNEERLIKSKIKNLLSLDYPEGLLEFVFVDGGSTDRTIETIRRAVSQSPRIKLIKTSLRSKTRQINKVLPKIKTEIVVVNDADGELHSQAIKNIIKEFNTHPKAAVVGAYTCPKKTIPLDAIYWQKQNQIRLLESSALSSSIVIANCYGFKRGLLDKLPEGVVADDIYVAFLAQAKGLRTIYTNKALVFELRAPQKFSEFFYHKFRKAHAYIKEVLRFFSKSARGDWRWKLVYLTKLLQVIVGPLLILAFLFLTVRLLFLGSFLLPMAFVLALFFSIAAASQTLKPLGGEKKLTKSPLLTIASFILVNLILFSALLVYPFYRQTASYQKLGQGVS